MYIVYLNKLEGVELITKALRKTTCIASHDLAAGIERNLHYLDEDGVVRPMSLGSKQPTLRLVPKEK